MVAVAQDLVGLHGTDPVSVFLSAAARMKRPSIAAVEDALYSQRSLLRMLGMRRTLFVEPLDLVPVVQAAASLGRCAGPLAGGWLLTLNPRHTSDFGRAPFWCGSVLLLMALFLIIIAPVRHLDATETALPSRMS